MAKLKLITEDINDLVVEAQGTDVYVSGVFSTAEEKNKNGRKYKKETLEREANRLYEDIKRGSLFGELNHPTSPEINLERATIKLESLKWDGNNLIGKAKVLDTPLGKIAKTLIKEGKIGISSRGLGTVNEDGYVNDNNFKLITWDLVGNPSNHTSWVNGVYEAETFGDVQDEENNPKVEINEAKKEYQKYIKALLADLFKKV